jgi:hypothetical protein
MQLGFIHEPAPYMTGCIIPAAGVVVSAAAIEAVALVSGTWHEGGHGPPTLHHCATSETPGERAHPAPARRRLPTALPATPMRRRVTAEAVGLTNTFDPRGTDEFMSPPWSLSMQARHPAGIDCSEAPRS